MVFLELHETGTDKSIWINKNHINMVTKINKLDPKMPADAGALIIVAGNPLLVKEAVDVVMLRLDAKE